MKQILLKKALPHISAILLFIVISLVYFYPVLNGYELKQGDIEKHKAMSHEIVNYNKFHDDFALWSGNMFAGMPTTLTSSPRPATNITGFISKIFRIGLPHPASALFLYLIGFYLLAIAIGISPWLSIIGAIGFAFSSYFLIIIEAGHTSKTYAIACMAPILGGVIAVLRGKIKWGVLLIAIFTALQFYYNHLQITYYLFIVVIIYIASKLIEAVKEGTAITILKRIAFIGLAAIIGILPNLGSILNVWEYSKASTRGKSDLTINAQNQVEIKSEGLDKDYITQWSFGVDETFTLILPQVKGGSSMPLLGNEKVVEELQNENPDFFRVVVEEYQEKQNLVKSYFGNQPIVSGPVYLGIVVVLLAIFALVFLRNALIYSLLISTLLALLLSWGKNFMGLTDFFIDYVPLYNKFRAVAMILVIVELTVPILAILFLHDLIMNTAKYQLNLKKLAITSGAFIIFIAIFFFAPDTLVELESINEINTYEQRAQSEGIQSVNLLRSSIIEYREGVISDAALRGLKYLILAMIVVFLFIRGLIKRPIFLFLLGGIILTDLWTIDKLYLNNAEAQNSTSRSKFKMWEKPDKYQIPFDPNSVDEAIYTKETTLNPQIPQIVEQRFNAYRKESGRKFSQREIINLKYAALMENSHYRVLNTTSRLDQDVRTPYFHKTLGGYHGAKMKRYQEFVDFYLALEHYQVQQAFARGGRNYVQNITPQLKYSNLLNVKYIIGNDNNTGLTYVENSNRNGHAWFVKNFQIVTSADSAILALRNKDLKNTAVIELNEDADSSPFKNINYSPHSKIALTKYNPNKMVYKYDTDQEQFAVFSEIFYGTAWKAYVNGEETEVYPVNYILRGINIPAGAGEVEFIYESKVYNIGKYLSILGSLLLLVLIIGLLYNLYKDKKISE